jgi:hypothetical protein
MSEAKTVQVASGGFPLAGILTIIFVLAKLTGHIAWSWWWVFCPLWLGAVIGLGIFALVLVVGLIIALLVAIFDR